MIGNAENKFELKFLDLASRIKKAGFSSQDLGETLAWGQLYGRFLSSNFSSLYRDDGFEQLIIDKYLSEYQPSQQRVTPRQLHVISEAYASGGHTRLMEKIISLNEVGSDVVVVRANNDPKLSIRTPPLVKIYSKSEGYEITELVDIMASYHTIYLHIHPDDLVAAVAVGVAKKISSAFVVFINHADHIFSYGFLNADVVAEVSQFGFELSSKLRGVKSEFIGIPVDLSGLRLISGWTPKKSIKIFTAGSRLKYKPMQTISFQKIIKKVLCEVEFSEVTVVGPSIIKDYWWWLIKLRFFSRLKIVRSLPHGQYIEEINQADVYVDSYPMTGGTAFPEARSKNLLVTGVISGSCGYTPFDALKFATADYLVMALNELRARAPSLILKLNNDQNVIDSAAFVHSLEEVEFRINNLPFYRENKTMPPKFTEAVDIDFYRRDWVARGVFSLSLSDIRVLLRFYRGQGGIILIRSFFGFGVRHFTSIVTRFFLRLFD